MHSGTQSDHYIYSDSSFFASILLKIQSGKSASYQCYQSERCTMALVNSNKEGFNSLMIIQLMRVPQLQEWAWPYSGDPTRIFNRCAPFPYQAIHSALLPSTLAIIPCNVGWLRLGLQIQILTFAHLGFCCLNTKTRPRRM